MLCVFVVVNRPWNGTKCALVSRRSANQTAPFPFPQHSAGATLTRSCVLADVRLMQRVSTSALASTPDLWTSVFYAPVTLNALSPLLFCCAGSIRRVILKVRTRPHTSLLTRSDRCCCHCRCCRLCSLLLQCLAHADGTRLFKPTALVDVCVLMLTVAIPCEFRASSAATATASCAGTLRRLQPAPAPRLSHTPLTHTALVAQGSRNDDRIGLASLRQIEHTYAQIFV